jgi:alkylation response protein AidB-like acyl-CoA dehydrogenase
VDLELTDDQAVLGRLVEDFLEKESPIEVVRAAEPLGFDAELWHKVVELGLPAMTIPEEHGGGGAGLLDLALAVERFGAALAPVPLVEAAVASGVLAEEAATGEELRGLLAESVAGDALVTLALAPAEHGVAGLVPAGAVADAVVALDGDELVVVRDRAIGPATPLEAVPNLGSMPIADRDLGVGERIVVARGAAAVATHRRAVHRWEALTGAALVGLGARALDIGVSYVLERRAFGSLIGSFQSVTHRLADDATALDGARLLALEAAWAVDAGRRDADVLATMAALGAGEAAFSTAAHCLQFHGGYGYTLEYDIQLYFRRAKAWSLVAGDPDARLAELGRRAFGPPSDGRGV